MPDFQSRKSEYPARGRAVYTGRNRGQAAMTDQQIEDYLRENGYPERVWQSGREGLILRWREFVQDVEQGYTLSFYDYCLELDVRALIEICGIGPKVAPEDARFKAMLTATDKRVWDSGVPNAFWDFGHPINAEGDLLEDMKAAGLA
jgi:hypothetical protein